MRTVFLLLAVFLFLPFETYAGLAAQSLSSCAMHECCCGASAHRKKACCCDVKKDPAATADPRPGWQACGAENATAIPMVRPEGVTPFITVLASLPLMENPPPYLFTLHTRFPDVPTPPPLQNT